LFAASFFERRIVGDKFGALPVTLSNSVKKACLRVHSIRSQLVSGPRRAIIKRPPILALFLERVIVLSVYFAAFSRARSGALWTVGDLA
jgi:hypothetical protein